MSRKPFTKEQIATLRQNPYVYRVTPSTLTLTKEFKEVFYTEYQKGISPRVILEDHGFDINVIGERRIWSISDRIRKEYEKYGEFHEGYRPRNATDGSASVSGQSQTEQDQINSLRHEVDYLRQEVEFLKKISSIRNTRK